MKQDKHQLILKTHSHFPENNFLQLKMFKIKKEDKPLVVHTERLNQLQEYPNHEQLHQ